MKRKRNKKCKSFEKQNQDQENDDMLDYIHEMAGIVEGESIPKEEFKKMYESLKEKWRQRPLEYWLEHYKIPSKDDGNRDKPT